MKKNNFVKLIIFLVSELISFFTTVLFLNKYNHILGILLVQLFYFLPILCISFYVFLSKKSSKNQFIGSTTFLVLYAIFLYFFIKSFANLFTNIKGILNFVEYAWKIYCICLPLVGIKIFAIKKENSKKIYFLQVLRIVLLFVVTFVFENLFGLKGVLYGWSLSEFFMMLLFLNGKCPSAK